MKILVADIGGTNSRLALASGGKLDTASIGHFRNADFGSFYDVMRAYLSGADAEDVATCCIAVAGPIAARRARLTNLDWEIAADAVNEIAGSERAHLINDLTALGYSLTQLPPGAMRMLCGSPDRKPRNGQSLVIGMGTGFNVCPVKTTADGRVSCFDAEAGHAGIGAGIAGILRERLGTQPSQFSTVEECFAGRGMSRLFAAVTRSQRLDAGEIVAACRDGSDEDAAAFMQFHSALLGTLCRQLVLQYMPLDGLYFAGSVARGVFSCGFTDEFAAALYAPGKFDGQFTDIPVRVISEDTAPLFGCVEAAMAMETG